MSERWRSCDVTRERRSVKSLSVDFADAPAAYAAILDGHTRGKSAVTFA